MDVQAPRARHGACRQHATPPSYNKVNPRTSDSLYCTQQFHAAAFRFGRLWQNMLLSAFRWSTACPGAGVRLAKYASAQLDPLRWPPADRAGRSGEAVRAGNVNLPTGILYGPQTAFTSRRRPLLTADAYAPLIVASATARRCACRIGPRVDRVENDKVAAWFCVSNTQHHALMLGGQPPARMNTVKVPRTSKPFCRLPAAIARGDQDANLYDRSRDHGVSADAKTPLVDLCWLFW
jgi:HAE1 family hydrophobic/amphiphilic exporter-1